MARHDELELLLENSSRASGPLHPNTRAYPGCGGPEVATELDAFSRLRHLVVGSPRTLAAQ